MAKPAWLSDLHQTDRVRAEKWLREVGEPRFMRIATAATTVKREKNRPKDDNSIFEYAAVLWWVTHPELNKAKAAHEAAKEYHDGRAAGGRNMTIERLRRIMRESLEAGPELSVLDCAVDEAARKGLPIRPEAANSLVPSARFLKHKARAESLMKAIYPGQIERTDRFQAFLPPPMRQPITAEQLDREQRFSAFLQSMDGIICPETPISLVASLFDDTVSAAKDLAK